MPNAQRVKEPFLFASIMFVCSVTPKRKVIMPIYAVAHMPVFLTHEGSDKRGELALGAALR